MGRCVTLRVAAVVLGICLFTAAARGQANYSSLSGGYSNLTLQHSGPGDFYDHSGPYIDAEFGWKIPNPDFPLLIGIGFTGSGYWDSQDIIVPVDDNTALAQTTLYSNVGLFEIEPRIGLALWSAGNSGFFLKPRIGAGLLIDSYSVDHAVTTATGNTFIYTDNYTSAAFEVRPAVQAGYSWGPGQIGAELSYMAAWGDFGRFGNDAQEFRAGVFFTWRF